jgi:hypothetical protein
LVYAIPYMKNKTAIILIGFLVSVLNLQAAKAPLSAERKVKESSHIVSGVVLDVSKKKVRRYNRGGNGFGSVDYQVEIKIQIEQIMKGEGLVKGKTLVGKTRQAKSGGWLGTIWTRGQHVLPAKKDKRTFYLNQKKNDEKTEYWILTPNGIDE